MESCSAARRSVAAALSAFARASIPGKRPRRPSASKARLRIASPGTGMDVGPACAFVGVGGSVALAGLATPSEAKASSSTGLSRCRRSGRDGAQIVIDLVLHVDLDVGLGAGLDVAIVFGEIHPAEIERLELFC